MNKKTRRRRSPEDKVRITCKAFDLEDLRGFCVPVIPLERLQIRSWRDLSSEIELLLCSCGWGSPA